MAPPDMLQGGAGTDADLRGRLPQGRAAGWRLWLCSRVVTAVLRQPRPHPVRDGDVCRRVSTAPLAAVLDRCQQALRPCFGPAAARSHEHQSPSLIVKCGPKPRTSAVRSREPSHAWDPTVVTTPATAPPPDPTTPAAPTPPATASARSRGRSPPASATAPPGG